MGDDGDRGLSRGLGPGRRDRLGSRTGRSPRRRTIAADDARANAGTDEERSHHHPLLTGGTAAPTGDHAHRDPERHADSYPAGPDRAEQRIVITGSFPAMGTTIEVVARDGGGLDATAELFARHERRFSRFLADSELTALNRGATAEVEVSTLMAQVLTIACDLQHRTDGLVDPAVGGAMSAWGYDRTFAEVRDIDEAPAPTIAAGWQIRGNVLTRPPGTVLDLGGVVKGWAADQAVETGLALVVAAGGDVRSALTTTRIDVRDPWGDTAATIVLGSGGLATSSVARRRWQAGETAAHHLIDPRTGAPAISPIVAATASCGTAVESEAAAKAVLLRGESGLAWADEQDWIDAAMVVWRTGSVFATTGWEMAA
jgi:FAD:protein FMN transferase